MSANDYILIKKPRTKWLITHRDADTCSILGHIGSADTMEEAVIKANNWQKDNLVFVEYGLHIQTKT
jgi:hypothetical protein